MNKSKWIYVWVSVSVAFLLAGLVTGLSSAAGGVLVRALPAAALGTGFTYQGTLYDGGAPADGVYDFQFALYDAQSGGAQVGSTLDVGDVTVSDGQFSVALDFGDVFDGTALWLEVRVRPGDSTGSYTVLTPRQALTVAPYAGYAMHAPWSGVSGVPADLLDGDDDTTYTAGTGLDLSGGAFSLLGTYQLPQTCTNGQIAEWDGSGWVCGDAAGTTDFWSLSGNAGTDPAVNYLGTRDAVSLTLGVSGTTAMRLEPTDGTPNLIGGYSGNSVAAGVKGAVIAGGGYEGYENQVTADYASVGGGGGNTASGFYASVGGGRSNTASYYYASVGGGRSNTASYYYASVGGGWNNTASGSDASVGGGRSNTASWSYATVGGGYYNTASGGSATVGGGYSNTASGGYASVGGGRDNTASGGYASVGGGRDNTASGSYASVGGGYGNIASGAGAFVGGGGYNGSFTNGNLAAGLASTIGGGYGNVITTTADYATVGGGGSNVASSDYASVGGGANNTASGLYASVGGGYSNKASGADAAVGGGYNNTASGGVASVGGGSSNTASGGVASVGGGSNNTASGSYASVGGGRFNTASRGYATVGGGDSNTASGDYATVPGGQYNTAAGAHSFAAGRRAKANNQGCFVWGDSTNADVACSANNRTIFRSSGGFYIYTNSGLIYGAYLAANGSSWNAVSNKALKENFAPVDTQALLESLAQIEITTWNYKSQDDAIRHIGPMAQDFNQLVEGLGGEGELYINSLDADGVALAAIQGLYQQNQELYQQNEELKSENQALARRVSALERGAVAGLPWAWLAGGALLLLSLGVNLGLVLGKRRGAVK